MLQGPRGIIRCPALSSLPRKVSVLIVNFHAYLEAGSCLESLKYHKDDLGYQNEEFEVIFVDHGSEPVSANLLHQKFPWIHLIATDANPGFAAGVNRAARASLGRYLLLLNPDCVVHGDAARRLAEWLDEHPHVGAVGPLVEESDGSVQASARRFPGPTTLFAGRTSWLTRRWPGNRWTRRNLVAPEPGGGPVEVDWVSGACMMIRREAFESVEGFDERFFMYWEDADFCLRLKRAGWPVVYNPRESVTHLTGRSSARAHTRSLLAFHRSAFLYFRKNSGRLAQVAAPVVFVALYARFAMKLAALEVRRLSKGTP
jgi:GT2 family glycosyltransferase